ncbi:transposase [Caldalkalibacillus uzonensis]|uniref:Transposase n=1 Tax=Caldalkalibacillus uzonensis TaxID=353224 RepID=A0ABU0CSY8_9BACI|nr:hypothetical protein [Caldalkalibacillus uzonensis]MDQ0339464.1 transposase [Caldalkalibacillus uzonensis]
MHQQASTFILITNEMDEEKLTDEDMLKGYKAQQTVENRFRFLKNPYFVGSIYLSKPEWVEAFAYIMMISVMIYSLFEYLIRREMAKEKEPLELMGGRASFRPTGEAVLEILDTVQIVQMEQNGQTIRLLPENLRSQIERILTLLGMGPAIYTQLKGGNGVENTRV